MKIIVASFFPVYPVTYGSSVVISSFFEKLPYKNKVLYQISNKKINIKNKKIKCIYQFYDLKIFKFISVLILIKNIFFELHLSKNKNILFIEGASWIGYSFLLVLICKLFNKKVKVIYKGHSIEYEIRKKNSNYIISKLSFFLKNSYIKILTSQLQFQN